MTQNIHHIRLVRRDSLDVGLWDQCIDQSANRVIYAFSFYLDQMASHWDGLVFNDYQAVMPLTWNRKWGVSYLYQPPFTQRLGVFSRMLLTPDLLQQFISRTGQEFSFAEIFLHEGNPLANAERRNNFCLFLQAGYEKIRSGYSKSLTRNLQQALENDLVYKECSDYQEAIDVFSSQYGERLPHLLRGDFESFSNVCQEAQRRNMLRVRKVVSATGRLLSIAVFFHDGKRIYNILPTTLPEGRWFNANHLLLDRVIHEYSGQELVLDFEGSDIPGIRSFYEKFGAVNQPYYFLRYNHLPYPIRIFKRKGI